MRTASGLGAFVFVLGTVGALVPSDAGPVVGEPSKAGIVWVTNRRHKVGNVLAGRLVEHTFTLANRSDEPITIEAWVGGDDVQLEATLRSGRSRRPFEPPADVGPGDEIDVELTIDTHGRIGPLSFRVNVETPANPSLPPAILSVRVLPLFRFEPIACRFGPLRPDGRPTRELWMSNPLDEPFRPRIDDASVPPALRVTVEPDEPDERGWATTWRVRIAVAARPTVETFPAVLHGTAELAEREELRKPNGQPRTRHRFELLVQAGFEDWVEAVPHAVDFGRAQRPRERALRLRSADPSFPLDLAAEDFTVETVAGELDWSRSLRVELDPPRDDTDDRRVRLTLSPTTGLTADAFGHLIVRLGHPDLAELRVPLTARR